MINKRLIQTVPESKRYIMLNVMYQWITLLANIVAIFTIGIYLQWVVEGKYSLEKSFLVFGIVAVMICIRFVCNKLAAKMSYMSSKKVKTVLRDMIYSKLLRLGNGYREKVSTSEVVQVSVEGVEQLEIYFGRYLPQFFYSLLAPITLFVILSFVNFKYALVLFLCVPLIPGSIIMVQKLAKKLLAKYWSIYTGLGDSFLENVGGMTTLKIYQADAAKNEEMNEEAEHFRKITMKVLTMQLNSVTLMDLIAFGGAAIGVVIATLEFNKGAITLFEAFAIILLAAEFFIPLRLLGSYFHIAMNGMAASDKLFRLLDMEEKQQVKQNVKVDGVEEGLVVDHVNFSYNEERQILKDVSIAIPKGSFVSLVGESGCGKSTIAALSMGFLTPTEGTIVLDGVNAHTIPEKDYMGKITYLSHNSYLFAGTVKENLLVGNKNATEAMMLQVLKQVKLYDFIMENGGLAMMIKEKASNLSGGQAQRMALARALLHDSEYYIFDEATSNIDVESEEAIMEVLKELSMNKTILFITHRLAQVVNSTKIYALEHGTVVGAGTHEELMREGGKYATMFTAQQELEQYVGRGE